MRWWMALLWVGCSTRNPEYGDPPDLGVKACTELSIDVHNCGACGHDCSQLPGVDPAAVRCTLGVCNLSGACLPGRGDCSSLVEGCETDLSTANHCGSCTNVCGGDAPLCAGGPRGGWSCAASCGLDSHLCGTTCADDRSVASCGQRCTPCPAAPANAVEICDPIVGCDFECKSDFVRSGDGCVPSVSVDTPDLAGAKPDLSTPGAKPPCDCSQLCYWPNNFGSGDFTYCPITNTCVGTGCCQENTVGTGGLSCSADPACEPSDATFASPPSGAHSCGG